MIDKESTAAKNFYKEIRRFSERTQSWESQISYETKPDEAHDLTLVSQRVYGRRDEYSGDHGRCRSGYGRSSFATKALDLAN